MQKKAETNLLWLTTVQREVYKQKHKLGFVSVRVTNML